MIVFVWRRHENMSLYTASRVRTRYERIGSSDVYKLRKRASESQATVPPAAVPGVPTTRPWPIRQKRIGTNRMLSNTRHNSELILDRDDSPLGCFHLAMTYVWTKRPLYRFSVLYPPEQNGRHFGRWHFQMNFLGVGVELKHTRV